MSCGSTTFPTALPIDHAPKALALSRPFPRLAYLFANLRRLAKLYARRRQRLGLLALDDQLLHHIGISREQALAEGRKPFWM